ncbi:MAG: AI-2E family transporter [Gallionella sp.]|nr:AI-2E family transporter [Gallionella sp.]
MEKSNSEFWMQVKLILVGILSIAALLLLYYSRSIVIVSLIGIGIGVLIAPILSFARRKFKIPRALSALLCFVVIAIIIGGASFGIWYLVSDQVESLSKRAPEISANLNSRLLSLFMRYPWLQAQLEALNVGATAQGLVSHFFEGLQTSFTAIGGLLFALIISLYTAVSLNDYFAAVVRAFPQNRQMKVASVLSRCATILRLWFRAQMIDMLILGFMTGIGLWITGVDYWAVWGLLTAIFGIIPYLGTLIVVGCASIITLASEPSLVLWVIAVFVVVQQIEGNIILPMLMKGQVELPEVPLLIFILLMGSWLGIMGVFLAPPFFATMRVLYVELYLPRVGDETR